MENLDRRSGVIPDFTQNQIIRRWAAAPVGGLWIPLARQRVRPSSDHRSRIGVWVLLRTNYRTLQFLGNRGAMCSCWL